MKKMQPLDVVRVERSNAAVARLKSMELWRLGRGSEIVEIGRA
jgi:hypothetical protein